MLNNYQEQAAVWDWDAYDETPEYEYWRGYAARFGNKALVPMCALGQLAAYLAGHGLRVTAFDITPEMIVAGKARFGSMEGLELLVADLLALDLDRRDYDFAFLAGNGDFHLLQTLDEVERALRSLHHHLRTGGCLALELALPAAESYSWPKRAYQPRVPRDSDRKIWKENEGRYDAAKKRNDITQTVHIESAGASEQFTHQVRLQYYERGEILGALQRCGFSVTGEFANREREPWRPGCPDWFVEAIQRGAAEPSGVMHSTLERGSL